MYMIGTPGTWFDDVTYVYDDVTYVYDDVTYVYDDVTSTCVALCTCLVRPAPGLGFRV